MRHIPVLLDEVVSLLALKSDDNVIDCTLGDGGHAEKILEVIGPNGRLLGIDADTEAILSAKRILYRFAERVIYARDNFENLKDIVSAIGFRPVQGILLDLGWSIPQFTERGRGFSFERDEPLDMRYHKDLTAGGDGFTAGQIVNNYSERELSDIFRRFGEEKLHAEIAAGIVSYRQGKEIMTTGELTNIILSVYRRNLHSEAEVPWVGGRHPATLIFQALRLEVNRELSVLRTVLPQAVEILSAGGRLAVISFHSLEDRIVKRFFQDLPIKEYKIINKKPLTPGKKELADNPRARSAKLRVIEKK